ncbi:hypothetical protein RCL1_007084 [Eukaryota sp. TZLM3-RCL]
MHAFANTFLHVGLSSDSLSLTPELNKFSDEFFDDRFTPAVIAKVLPPTKSPRSSSSYDSLANSILPYGISIHDTTSSDYRATSPFFFIVSITDIDASRQYLGVIHFEETIPKSRIPPSLPLAYIEQGLIKSTCAFALLFSHSHFNGIRSVLLCLLSLVKSGTSSELFLRAVHYLLSLSVPPPGRALQFDFLSSSIALASPGHNQFPLLDLNAVVVFERLSLENVLDVYSALLLEQSIVFISKNYSILSTIIHFFISIIYPFSFVHSVCEVLPVNCFHLLQCPTPFIFGIGVEPKVGSIKSDCLVVNVDSNRVSGVSMTLPDKIYGKLWKELKKAGCDDVCLPRESAIRKSMIDVFANRSSVISWPEGVVPSFRRLTSEDHPQYKSFPDVKVADGCIVDWERLYKSRHDVAFSITLVFYSFLKVTVTIFQEYSNFIKIPKNSSELRNFRKIFNLEGFLRSITDQNLKKWTQNFMESAAVGFFIQKRLTPDRYSFNLLYFDEQIIAKNNRSNWTLVKKPTPFLSDTSLHLSRVYLMPPINFGQLRPRGTPKIVRRAHSEISVQTVVPSNLDQIFSPNISFSQPFVIPKVPVVLAFDSSSSTLPILSHVLVALNSASSTAISAITNVQCLIKSWFVRVKFLEIKNSALIIERYWYFFIMKRRIKEISQSISSIKNVQSLIKCRLVRTRFVNQRHASITIQRFCRGRIARNRVVDVLSQRCAETAFTVIYLWTIAKVPISIRSSFIFFIANFPSNSFYYLTLWNYELYKMSHACNRPDLVPNHLKENLDSKFKPLPFESLKSTISHNSRQFKFEQNIMINTLKSESFQFRLDMFAQLNIDINSKNRKKCLVNRLLAFFDCPGLTRKFYKEALFAKFLLEGVS